MKKTRKIMLLVLLLSLASLLAACFCACSDGMNGTNGKDGANGKSAYEIWLDEGHTGTQSDFLDWLKGKDGSDGTGGNGSDGEDGKDGQDGKDGKSAYEIWLDNGHTGTETDFLEWLKGEDGKDGSNGSDGQDGAKGDKGETGAQGEKGSDGKDGKSAYQIFKEQYPYYQGTEEQWLIALVNGNLRIQAVTFQSEVADDITKYVLNGYALTDIPDVPEKEGQTSAKWSVSDFSDITADMTVTAEYDMRKYVTFHNEFTDDEDIIKVVQYGDKLPDGIPTITEKANAIVKWSITDFSQPITRDVFVEAVYETQGLQFTAIKQQTEYRVSKGAMDINTEELFIPAEHGGKPVTVIDTNAFQVSDLENRLQFSFAYIPDSVTEIREEAFQGCEKLKRISIGKNVSNIGNRVFADCGLISVTLPNSITVLNVGLFSSCRNLIDVTLPNGITSIGSDVFIDCDRLANVNLPNSVVSIGSSVFRNCRSLADISIPNGVTGIGPWTFEGCSSLKSLLIPQSVVKRDNDWDWYLYLGGCDMLERIEVDEKNPTYSSQNGILYNNAKTEMLCLPNAIKGTVTIPNGVTELGVWQFNGLEFLENIIVETNNPNYASENGILYNKAKTEILAVPGAIKGKITLPYGVTSCRYFNGRSGITSVVLPESITVIECGAFSDCENLTQIILSKSLERVYERAFYNCNNLAIIYYTGTQTDFSRIDINSGNGQFTDAMVYYYSETKPTSDGYYWHYDTDGITPVLWGKED